MNRCSIAAPLNVVPSCSSAKIKCAKGMVASSPIRGELTLNVKNLESSTGTSGLRRQQGPRGKGPSGAPSTTTLTARGALVRSALNMHPRSTRASPRTGTKPRRSPDVSNRLIFVASRSRYGVREYRTAPLIAPGSAEVAPTLFLTLRCVTGRFQPDTDATCGVSAVASQHIALDRVHRFSRTTRLVASSWPLERTGPRTVWLLGSLERGSNAVVWGRRSWAESSWLRPPGHD